MTTAPASTLDALLAHRLEAGARFFGAEAERIAHLCHRMAERFARGGRLIAAGAGPVARSDVRHVTVEFVHPVIVGKRALPAIGVGLEGGSLDQQLAMLAAPDDIVMAFDGAVTLAPLRERGCLTIAFGGDAAEAVFAPPTADPLVAQELVETLYHVLWELVHVFFEHRGLLEGRPEGATHDAGAAGFLYPFLTESEHDLGAVVEDVRRSVLAKAAEVAALREQTLADNRDAIRAAAADLRRLLDAGGRVLALGNGGSATDAMDAVADLRDPPHGWPARRGLDLTEDTAIITAVANDVGADAIFARQVIAHGRPGDALLAFSTSGNSRSAVDALAEARRRGIVTVALVGYDGGQIGASGLADHLILTRSQYVPRIQEAQASAWHALRELIERDG